MDTKPQKPTPPLRFDLLQVPIPTEANQVRNFDPDVVADDAESTCIVVHPRFPALVESFLEFKRIHGSKYEKTLYETSETFTWRHEVARLIEKRPLAFVGPGDSTLLRNGGSIEESQKDEWDRNGTSAQHLNSTLTLEEYLSYDEIMMAALIGASGPSHFINDGNRYNCGAPGAEGTFEERGIIIGLVGARFERADRMESTYVLPPVARSHQIAALTDIFQSFLGVPRDKSIAFDVTTYKARIRIAAKIFLCEANRAARGVGKKAHAYVVGLGLGVWQPHWIPSEELASHYVDTYTEAVEELQLPHIGTLEFAWIGVPRNVQEKARDVCLKQNIQAIFSRRNPAEKLTSGQLLVLSYAWDGNSFPGNKYWEDSLCGSGDPAAACMSTIPELHNPLVNTAFPKRIRVVGDEAEMGSPERAMRG